MKSLTLQEQYILLSVYRLKNNAYLATVRDHILENTGKDLSIGTVYVPLDRLRKMGYLRTEVSGPSPKVGGRSIKYYFITDEGIKALHEMKKINDTMWTGFSEEAIVK
ncbi:MAG: PadR family transcriptional regulator [bacterium]|nr:PadR family transcriptional regulator [bacterium]